MILKLSYGELQVNFCAKHLDCEVLAHNFDVACSRMQAQFLCIMLHMHF
jgi:hypothetical protein